jgi:hypothetical protein
MSVRFIWMSGLVLTLLAGPRAELLGGEADEVPDWPYLRPPGTKEEIPEEHLKNVRHRGTPIGEEPGRLLSLEELGNPHLPDGTPLEDSEVDPELARVDPEDLRQRYITLVETRRYNPSSLPRPESVETAAPISRPAKKMRRVSYSTQATVALAAAAITALAILWLRRGPRRLPARAD